jgi:hypothetical protein
MKPDKGGSVDARPGEHPRPIHERPAFGADLASACSADERRERIGEPDDLGPVSWAATPPLLADRVLRAVARRRRRGTVTRRVGALTLGILVAAAAIVLPLAAALTWVVNHTDVAHAAFGMSMTVASAGRALVDATGVALRSAWSGPAAAVVAGVGSASVLLAVWVRVVAVRRARSRGKG